MSPRPCLGTVYERSSLLAYVVPRGVGQHVGYPPRPLTHQTVHERSPLLADVVPRGVGQHVGYPPRPLTYQTVYQRSPLLADVVPRGVGEHVGCPAGPLTHQDGNLLLQGALHVNDRIRPSLHEDRHHGARPRRFCRHRDDYRMTTTAVNFISTLSKNNVLVCISLLQSISSLQRKL